MEKRGLKKTKSGVFILPILMYQNIIKKSPYYIGTYILNTHQPRICVVFQDITMDEDPTQLVTLMGVLVADPLYINQDVLDGEVIVEFRFPSKFKKDFDLILEGRYSELSREYKDILMIDHVEESLQGSARSMFDILYPTNAKRKAIAEALDVRYDSIPKELLDIPVLENEIFCRLTEYKEKYESRECVN